MVTGISPEQDLSPEALMFEPVPAVEHTPESTDFHKVQLRTVDLPAWLMALDLLFLTQYHGDE